MNGSVTLQAGGQGSRGRYARLRTALLLFAVPLLLATTGCAQLGDEAGKFVQPTYNNENGGN